MSARGEILTRLRLALRDVPADEDPDDVDVPRDYRRTGRATPTGLVEEFAERVEDYRATVYRCGPGQLATVTTSILAAHDTDVLLTPHDLPTSWYHGFAGRIRTDSPDDPLPVEDLDAADSVLTGCAAAVAATGTLILDSGRYQGRRALSLVPDHHVCVLVADQIGELVGEALARLDPTRPLTFVSGPSATSDIEFHRIEGVHGPRRLDVIVLT